ncbi:Uncharacterised protein [Mycobacteroides abscessus subsp. abscessus]|nr:Uncharacterised protein [Mycobacteroides abscessus subsp. abscessus]
MSEAFGAPAVSSPISAPKARSTATRCGRVVASSHAIETWSPSGLQMLMPSALAAAWICAALPGTCTNTVSKKRSCTTVWPPRLSPEASSCALWWIRAAMARSPSGPW